MADNTLKVQGPQRASYCARLIRKAARSASNSLEVLVRCGRKRKYEVRSPGRESSQSNNQTDEPIKDSPDKATFNSHSLSNQIVFPLLGYTRKNHLLSAEITDTNGFNQKPDFLAKRQKVSSCLSNQSNQVPSLSRLLESTQMPQPLNNTMIFNNSEQKFNRLEVVQTPMSTLNGLETSDRQLVDSTDIREIENIIHEKQYEIDQLQFFKRQKLLQAHVDQVQILPPSDESAFHSSGSEKRSSFFRRPILFKGSSSESSSQNYQRPRRSQTMQGWNNSFDQGDNQPIFVEFDRPFSLHKQLREKLPIQLSRHSKDSIIEDNIHPQIRKSDTLPKTSRQPTSIWESEEPQIALPLVLDQKRLTLPALTSADIKKLISKMTCPLSQGDPVTDEVTWGDLFKFCQKGAAVRSSLINAYMSKLSQTSRLVLFENQQAIEKTDSYQSIADRLINSDKTAMAIIHIEEARNPEDESSLSVFIIDSEAHLTIVHLGQNQIQPTHSFALKIKELQRYLMQDLSSSHEEENIDLRGDFALRHHQCIQLMMFLRFLWAGQFFKGQCLQIWSQMQKLIELPHLEEYFRLSVAQELGGE